MRARILIVVIAIVISAALAARQSRDPAAPTAATGGAVGTGTLSGVLVTDTPVAVPVRRATVQLSGGGITSTHTVGTDDAGRFVFTGLPAGSFTLSATKPGLVQTVYGSKHPGRGPGVPIALADGGRADVTMRMLPGAVITGTVTDSSGQPAPAIPVSAVELRQSATLVAPARAMTDDRGVYRIFGLAPGDYAVSALPTLRPVSAGRGVENGEVMAVTDAEVQWARRAIAGGTLGPAPGRGPLPPPGGLVVYAPVYYPGTTDVAAATRVSVAAGEEHVGVDLSLRIVAMARIAGTLTGADGQTVTPAIVSLFPRRGDRRSVADALVSSGALVLPRATMSATGFSIANVAPGEYTLVARTGSGQRGAAPPPPTAVALWSVTDITVSGSDQTTLVLRLLPGLRLSGSIAFDRSSTTPPADLRAIDLSLVPTGALAGALSASKAVIDPTGTFRFASLAPALYSLRVTPPPVSGGVRWALKSAMLNGRDLAEAPFEVRGGDDISGVVVIFTDRPTEISGRLVDASGAPLSRYAIVVIPVDRTLWVPNGRRLQSTTPATDGSFTIAGLPPGEYAIAAVEDVDEADFADPAFLSQILSSGFKLTLVEGQRTRQDLRAGG